MILENQVAAFTTLLSDKLEASYGGLSPRAASVLLTLQNRRKLDVTTLASIIGTTQPTATRLLDNLEKSGFVARGLKEGRNVSLVLSGQGLTKAKELARARLVVVAELLDGFSDDERTTLTSLIEKLVFTGTHDRAHARTVCRYCDHTVCQRDACPISRKATLVESRSADGDRQ